MAEGEKVRLDAAITVSVKKMVWEGKLSAICRINMNDLNVEMCRQPELVSWFGVVAVEAVDQVESLKNELAALKEDQDTLYADLDLLMRQESAGAKKPTETEIKSMVITHTRYKEVVKAIQAKRTEVREASVIFGKVSKILIALEHKRDMLIQLSANQRHEFITGDYGHEGKPL
jgi:hypothetical protein